MPRPTIGSQTVPAGVVFTISIPNACIDEQSYNLTHDQIRHLTAVQLQDAYRRRRRGLEQESGYGTGPSKSPPNATG